MKDLSARIEEGRQRYGIDLRNAQQLPKDRPPTEEEIRRYHAERHSGPFQKCVKCERILGGEMENAKSYRFRDVVAAARAAGLAPMAGVLSVSSNVITLKDQSVQDAKRAWDLDGFSPNDYELL